MRLLISLLTTATMLAGCAGAIPESAPPPMQKPVTMPVPATPTPARAVQPEGHWTDWPITPGNWVYRQDDRGSIGYFGEVGKNAIVTLRCDKGRGRIYLSRSGAALEPQIQIKTSASAKTVSAASAGGNPPYVAAELSPVDPILDAMAYSRGRFTVEAGGHLSLAIPAWAEISRIIEDCRV
jgi:hypothetical protein